jgi:hypothetical protein
MITEAQKLAELIDPVNSKTLARLKDLREKMGERAAISRASTFTPANVDGSAILTAFKLQRVLERMGK